MDALYWQPPPPEIIARTKKRESDFPEPKVDLWDENEEVIDTFLLYSTQWRTGASGVVGLDYTVFLHHLDRKQVTGEKYDAFLRDLRIVEQAAIAHINKPSS